MATKTQNFYGVTIDTVELGGYNDRGTITFKDDKGDIVKRSTRKEKWGLVQELVDAFNGEYPIDVIVDGRGSIAWIKPHGYDFDVASTSDNSTYEVWVFSSTGSQIQYRKDLVYPVASAWVKEWNQDNPADVEYLGESPVFKVVKASVSYSVEE